MNMTCAYTDCNNVFPVVLDKEKSRKVPEYCSTKCRKLANAEKMKERYHSKAKKQKAERKKFSWS